MCCHKLKHSCFNSKKTYCSFISEGNYDFHRNCYSTLDSLSEGQEKKGHTPDFKSTFFP